MEQCYRLINASVSCDSPIPSRCDEVVGDIIFDLAISTVSKQLGGTSAPSDVNRLDAKNVDDDTLYFHPHWLRYCDVIETVPDWFMFGIGTYITIICIAGIVGNVAVFSTFFRLKFLRTPSNYLIVNLAISDAAFSMTVGFPMMSIACFRGRWMWGQTACEYYAFIAAMCGFNSIGTMALIAVDRYRFASRPLEMLYKGTHRQAIAHIICVWIWSVLCTCPPLFGWGGYLAEGFQVSCTFDYLTRTTSNIAYNYVLVIVGFLLPVAIIIRCYVGIIRSTLGHTRDVLSTNATEESNNVTAAKRPMNLERQQRRKQELRMVKILAVMVFLYVTSWLPYALVAQFGILGFSDLVTPYTAEIPVLLAKTSAIWNPIVYALTGWRKIYLSRAHHRQLCKTWSVTSSGPRQSAKLLKMKTSAPERSISTPDENNIEMIQLHSVLLIEVANKVPPLRSMASYETQKQNIETCEQFSQTENSCKEPTIVEELPIPEPRVVISEIVVDSQTPEDQLTNGIVATPTHSEHHAITTADDNNYVAS